MHFSAKSTSLHCPKLHSLPTTDDGHPDLRLVRELFGMEQEELSTFLGIGLETYKSWESHRRNPSRAAVSLLKILVARPDVVCQVLGTQNKAVMKMI